MLKKLLLLFLLNTLCYGAEIELVQVKKIWDLAPHNAFTDLIIHKDLWYCVFREGSSHVPGSNGTVRIIRSVDGENWKNAAVISENGVDLRDPKVSIMPDGRLMLLIGGAIYGNTDSQQRRKLVSHQTRVSFSKDGVEWTPPQSISISAMNWLWRVTWNKDVGYGFSYTTGVPLNKMALTLWRTTDGINYTKSASPQLPTNCYPNETTIRFLSDDSMVSLIRNENKNGPAFIGLSKPPYDDWRFVSAGKPVQGPNFIILPDGLMAYSGRDFTPSAQTVVGFMTLEKCVPEVILPSKGDTSYPGMVWHNNYLWVSYYSTHEDKTSIYLAKLKVKK